MLSPLIVSILALTADPAAAPKRVAAVEGEKLTVTLPVEGKWSPEVVKTPAGLRVRVATEGAVLEGTRLVLRSHGVIATYTLTADGQVHVHEEPDRAMPRPLPVRNP